MSCLLALVPQGQTLTSTLSTSFSPEPSVSFHNLFGVPPLFSALSRRDWASWRGAEAIPALEGQSEVGEGGLEAEGGTGYLDWTGGRGGTHTLACEGTDGP